MDPVNGLLFNSFIPPCIHHEYICCQYCETEGERTIRHCEIQAYSSCFQGDQEDQGFFDVFTEFLDSCRSLCLAHGTVETSERQWWSSQKGVLSLQIPHTFLGQGRLDKIYIVSYILAGEELAYLGRT